MVWQAAKAAQIEKTRMPCCWIAACSKAGPAVSFRDRPSCAGVAASPGVPSLLQMLYAAASPQLALGPLCSSGLQPSSSALLHFPRVQVRDAVRKTHLQGWSLCLTSRAGRSSTIHPSAVPLE